MFQKQTFLFAPLDALGHFYASMGIAAVLKDRGHSVIFAAPTEWKGKLEGLGYGEELYTSSDNPVGSYEESGGDKWGRMVAQFSSVLQLSPMDFHQGIYHTLYGEIDRQLAYSHDQLKAIVERVKPDVLILDVLRQIPAYMDSGIPWILLVSITPLHISRENVPPAYMGYPTDSDPALWKEWDIHVEKVYQTMIKNYNKWLVENGSEEATMRFPYLGKVSPYANIYMYPRELDYTMYRPNPRDFYQFDTFMRPGPDSAFEIPIELKNLPGNLIYFSMGTIGSADVGLMRKLISILGKSPHKFIVSKGPCGDELELPINMWGANHVSQLSIIPKTDLVITHGGNNTITESFYFGKKVLVLPILFDQLDNAQRIYETGLGLKLEPYKVTEVELLEEVEKLLNDDLLGRRMISISQRIKGANSESRAADLVEKVGRDNRKSM